MVIDLGPELENALLEVARRAGVAPEALALNVLRDRFLKSRPPFEPRDEWERRLLSVASDCGGSLRPSDLTSEGMYE